MVRMYSNTVGYILIAVLCLGACGCMVGPDYSRPETAASTDSPYLQLGQHIEDVNDVAYYNWWQRFDDPVIDELVTKMLVNSYDLKAAAARLLQARAYFTEASGRRLPEVSYGLTRSRSKTSFNFGDAGRFSNLSTTFSQDISISYALDIFGKLKRSERAAWADMLSAEWNEHALINSMIATVIKQRIDIATIGRNLAIARSNTESRENTLKIVERRYSRGLVGPVDVRLARGNLETSKAVESVIELSLIKANYAMDVLIGDRPGLNGLLPESLPELPDLTPVAVGIPASLLDRRPDVMAAEMNLKAGSERVGVSVAQLFPDLTLTASVGRNADRWRDIWKSETEVYSAVFHLAQPIFKGGQIRSQIEGSKARYDELSANYGKTVLNALKEVEDALVGEQMLQEQLEYARQAFFEAEKAEELSSSRYQRGLENLLTVLESERHRRNAEVELAILKGQVWTTRVNLFLAIGGDWIVDEDEDNEQ